MELLKTIKVGFNTVNGKYCCNTTIIEDGKLMECFNTVNGKYCCNLISRWNYVWDPPLFQYRKR